MARSTESVTRVYRVDGQTGAATSLIGAADAPQFASLTAILFDSERRRLLVAGEQTVPDTNYTRQVFYEYDPVEAIWAVRSYPTSDVGGMAVSPASTAVYGLDLATMPGHEIASLATFNLHAARHNVVRFSNPFGIRLRDLQRLVLQAEVAAVTC